MRIDKFDQIGIVVRNLKKAANMYRILMDFKSDLKIVEQFSTVVYKGKEVLIKMKKIMQHFSGKQFEIIEVVESSGEHLYSEFLKEGKEGLHHLGVYTKDAEKIIKFFKEKYNIDVIQAGKAGHINFFYLNTKETLGFYLELIAI
ncbi:MAG: VOC family protein [Promethearchaeota archaeon]